jgi:tartrate dehydrogenase/decarboxylase / D-malate dehydrogenase
MMLEFLGKGNEAHTAAHDAIIKAIETIVIEGPRTKDMGGEANTTDVGKAIAEAI